jgi:tetratricopeptide (TPR) repeat protein
MQCRIVFVVAIALLSAGSMARAQEEVYVQGQEKPLKGAIKSETPKGIVLSTAKDLIPAEKIVDVYYEIPSIELRINVYKPAQKAEKASHDSGKEADRKAALADAIKKYDDAATKLTGADPVSKSAKRHLEYKVAMLRLRQVHEEGATPESAIIKLKDFKTKHPTSWQIVRVLEALGRLQMSQGDFKGAEDTFKELAERDLSAESKLEAQLLAVQAIMQDGRNDVALKTLQGMPVPEGPLAARVKVAQAQCLVATKQPDKAQEANKMLRQLVKDSTDRTVKAAAHNAIGQMLFEKGDYKEARWEFLWVDVVYNQDKDEHARALYYLWKTFENLNDAIRAQQCREELLSPQFAGLDYQRQAQKAAKSQ